MRFMENDATSLSLKLRDIASQSVGLSGRTLRKLPFLAHALYAQVSQIDQYKEETQHDSHMYLTEPYNRFGGVSLCFTESSDETVFGKRRIYRIKLTFHRVINSAGKRQIHCIRTRSLKIVLTNEIIFMPVKVTFLIKIIK